MIVLKQLILKKKSADDNYPAYNKELLLNIMQQENISLNAGHKVNPLSDINNK